MSEKKNKIKKIIVSILIVTLIVSVVSIFLISKTKSKSKNIENLISTVGQNRTIESEINSDVLNQKVCIDYDGNYIYYNVVDISFSDNPSYAEKSDAYYSIAKAKDKNAFLQYIANKKSYSTSKETITLLNGKYTKSASNTKIEGGLYFGNQNKSIIYTLDNKGTIEIDNKLYSMSLEISLTGYWLPETTQKKVKEIEHADKVSLIYIREKLSYGNVGDKYILITYTYQII